jgi:hypothetical protein
MPVKQIDYSQGQGVVGADHGQVGPGGLREAQQPGQIVGLYVDASDRSASLLGAFLADSSVPRSTPNLVSTRGLC